MTEQPTVPTGGVLISENPRFLKNAKKKVKVVKTSKDDRPPPPKPAQGSIGINVAMMNTKMPESLKPEEIVSLRELATLVNEKEDTIIVSYEVLLILLGICVGEFTDFRDEKKVKEKNKKVRVLSLKEKIEATLQKYEWLAFTDAPIGETVRTLLENIEIEGIIIRVEGTDKFQIP